MKASPRVLIGVTIDDNATPRHFLALSEELAKRGAEVTFLSWSPDEPEGRRLSNPNWHFFPGKRPTGVRDIVYALRTLWKRKPQCVLANFGSVNLLTLGGWLVGARVRIACYHTLSSQIDLDWKQGAFRGQFLRLRKKYVYRFATHLWANSEASLLDAQRVYGIPPEKGWVFRQSLPDPGLAHAARCHNHTVVCVGRLHQSKGQPSLLRAFKRVVQAVPEASLEIVGDGPERDSLVNLAQRLQLEAKCHFLGQMDHAEVLKRMAEAELVAIPSLREAFGMVNIEALAVGTPVVGSDVDGIREIIRDGAEGFLTAPGDESGLADKIILLLKDRTLRATMAQRARQRFLETFLQKKAISDQADWILRALRNQPTAAPDNSPESVEKTDAGMRVRFNGELPSIPGGTGPYPTVESSVVSPVRRPAERVDLVALGTCDIPWPLGTVERVERSVAALVHHIQGRLPKSDADCFLFWDSDQPPPNANCVPEITCKQGDLWHAGLLQGMGGLPGCIDFVAPTWMFNRDPLPDREVTSWRLSLRSCLVRTEVIRRLDFLRSDFQTIEAAALEWGHRLLLNGALIRHTPRLLAPSAASTSPQLQLPFAEELRFIFFRYGRKWAAWACFRALLTHYASLPAILRAWHGVMRCPRPAEPSPLRPVAGKVGISMLAADSVNPCLGDLKAIQPQTPDLGYQASDLRPQTSALPPQPLSLCPLPIDTDALTTDGHSHTIPAKQSYALRPPSSSPTTSLLPPGPSPRVSVLIPTVDRYPYLRVLLGQLRQQTIRPIEIIVVDQTDAKQRDVDLAAAFSDLPLKVIYRDSAGQCSSRNAGILDSVGDYILLLDDDVEILSDLIQVHLENLHQNSAAVSSGVAQEVGADPLPMSTHCIRASDVCPAGNTMIARRALEASGLFDLAYEKGARADGDLGMRLHLNGELMILDGSIQVLHHRAPSGGLRKHNARKDTRTTSRSRLFSWNLPSATEFYLANRYFSKRQIGEMIWLRTLSTLSLHGKRLPKAAKAVIGIAVLPHTLKTVRYNKGSAEQMLIRDPQIPRLSAKH